MILRSISAEGLGCLADPITLGPFAPGLNILHAPNGTGKSTLFRAVSLAFLEPHRGKSAEVQALRPWGRRLAPEVGVEFEHASREYRVRKRFLDGPLVHVETREGENWTSFAQGDNADEFLRELLLTESDKPRSVKRDCWGIAQVLWTTQGDLSLPPLASTVIDSIRSSVGAQLTAGDAAITRRVAEEYLKFFSPAQGKLKAGRNAAPQILLEIERDRLAAEAEAAEELSRQFDLEPERIGQLREAAMIAESCHRALVVEREQLRTTAELFEKLTSQRAERVTARDAATARYREQRERIELIEMLRQQVTDTESLLAASIADLPSRADEVKACEDIACNADTGYEASKTAEMQARRAWAKAQAAEQYIRDIDERRSISQRLDALAAAQSQIATATQKQQQLHAPTDARLRELRAVLAEKTDTQRRLEMARVSVCLVPEKALSITVLTGENTGTLRTSAGQMVTLAGAPNLTFTIPGIGRIEASGPVTDYEALRRDLRNHSEWVEAFSEEFGSADPEVLEARRVDVERLEAGLQEAHRVISSLLAGQSGTALGERKASLTERLSVAEAGQPEWRLQAPATVTRTVAASAIMTETEDRRGEAERLARVAHVNAEAARALLTIATGKQASLRESLKRTVYSLAGYLKDGLSDSDRRAMLDQAALDYDACRLAVERIEADLKSFTEDPRMASKRVAAKLATAEEEARSAGAQLLRAETRMQGLVERQPYAALTQIAERLGVIREKLEWEQMRMSALALLHNTLGAAQAEIMASVASPVERIATDYLEEICGSPLAEIRLTQALATERVIPAPLAQSADSGIELDRLSGGEREQIYFCTRLALGSELARRERQCVVLDDVLTATDDERMARICDLLGKVSDRLQVIVVTCHAERFAKLTGANRIGLLAALGRDVRTAGRR
jgi:AAA domain